MLPQERKDGPNQCACEYKDGRFVGLCGPHQQTLQGVMASVTQQLEAATKETEQEHREKLMAQDKLAEVRVEAEGLHREVYLQQSLYRDAASARDRHFTDLRASILQVAWLEESLSRGNTQIERLLEVAHKKEGLELQSGPLVEAVRELLRVKVCGSFDEAAAREKVKGLLPPVAENRFHDGKGVCGVWVAGIGECVAIPPCKAHPVAGKRFCNCGLEITGALHICRPPLKSIEKQKSALQAAVYCWLGFWRDKVPAEAVAALQQVLGPLEGESCVDCGQPIHDGACLTKRVNEYRCLTCDWVATAESRPLSRGTKVGCPKCGKDATYGPQIR